MANKKTERLHMIVRHSDKKAWQDKAEKEERSLTAWVTLTLNRAAKKGGSK